MSWRLDNSKSKMKNRVYDYDEYKKKNKLKFFRNALKIRLESATRNARTRPIEPETGAMFARMDKKRMENMIVRGELKIIGPRIRRLKVNFG